MLIPGTTSYSFSSSFCSRLRQHIPTSVGGYIYASYRSLFRLSCAKSDAPPRTGGDLRVAVYFILLPSSTPVSICWQTEASIFSLAECIIL
jgi:hypothetical protein